LLFGARICGVCFDCFILRGLKMIMHDYKNHKPAAEKTSAWDYVGAVAFAVILISLIFIATI
jgi:hypothetical protein